MGATNVLAERDRRPAGRRLFLRAAEIYAERFSDPDGRVRATFEIVWLSGWAPHESQQKPARRGSGHCQPGRGARCGKATSALTLYRRQLPSAERRNDLVVYPLVDDCQRAAGGGDRHDDDRA